jgi:anti-sigma B factor antagonist
LVSSSEHREVQRHYSALWCAVRRPQGAYVVHVYGELDLATVADFDAALDKALSSSAPRIVVDLAELSSIDSTGLRSLVLFNERCEDAGRELVIRPGSRRVRKVFEVTQLEDRLPFEDQ